MHTHVGRVFPGQHGRCIRCRQYSKNGRIPVRDDVDSLSTQQRRNGGGGGGGGGRLYYVQLEPPPPLPLQGRIRPRFPLPPPPPLEGKKEEKAAKRKYTGGKGGKMSRAQRRRRRRTVQKCSIRPGEKGGNLLLEMKKEKERRSRGRILHPYSKKERKCTFLVLPVAEGAAERETYNSGGKGCGEKRSL